jgi:hypothetical protein
LRETSQGKLNEVVFEECRYECRISPANAG